MLKVLQVRAQKEIEEMLVGTGRKRVLCYRVAGNLVELCPAVMWKAELASDELGYLAEENSKKNV